MNENVLPKAWETLMNDSSILPVVVQSIERFFDVSWSMKPNRHGFYEMIYMKRGNAMINVSGQSSTIGPNDIVILQPGAPHQFFVKSESGCEFIVLHFTFVNRQNIEYSEISHRDFLEFVSGKGAWEYIVLKVSQKNDIITVLNRIMKENDELEIGSDFLKRLLILELFVLISRALKIEWENSIKHKSPKLKELIQASVSYIHNNFEREISLKNIAAYVFLSPSYFIRAFKDEMGISPISYLLKVRIERAKELLKETDQKTGEIALGVGFSNQQRFNEIFKKHTGTTPLQYKKSVRKN